MSSLSKISRADFPVAAEPDAPSAGVADAGSGGGGGDDGGGADPTLVGWTFGPGGIGGGLCTSTPLTFIASHPRRSTSSAWSGVSLAAFPNSFGVTLPPW